MLRDSLYRYFPNAIAYVRMKAAVKGIENIYALCENASELQATGRPSWQFPLAAASSRTATSDLPEIGLL